MSKAPAEAATAGSSAVGFVTRHSWNNQAQNPSLATTLALTYSPEGPSFSLADFEPSSLTR